ncbi:MULTISPECIES: response regulator [Alphaproteobacteria]|nr:MULTISPECIES: response regulator [Alphaproteobacteria]ABQ39284.1 putative response regulator receiver (CheY-like protein) [Bradyrhizobium sp. BTAi1]MBN9255353.1 response regulator [Mesorhizobium sp.]MCT4471676.1 response regulator [Bosea spartocytisi]MDR7258084.1 CheY-like chemotaxis protein [Sphingomonas sp. BE270]
MLPEPALDREKPHVLVVEDEVLMRALIADELRTAGCAVIEANSADQALDYLVAGGKVDLMFSDIQMPGSLNGLQLAERVRADFPTVPVILTSGNDHLNSETMPGRFIAKPYDITQTVALVFVTLGVAPPGTPA